MKKQIAIAALAVLALSATAWAQNDMIIGMWKLNLAKSQYDPGPPPKSMINKYELQADGAVKTTTETVNAQGEKTGSQYTCKYDGKECPVVNSGPGAASGQTASFKRIDAYTTERITKTNGKITARMRREVSKDGKMLTVVQHGVNAQGEPTGIIYVYDKQ